jgi:threonine-phosphate decarboxylase
MILGHGDDGYLYKDSIKVNFSSNVFYQGLPKGLKEHLSSHWDAISRYPEANAESLQKAIAGWHQLEDPQILVTNGATEAFYLIAHHLRNKSATIIVPSFAEYEDACLSHTISLECMEWESVNKNTLFTTEAVFFGNPNNPTGATFSKKIIFALLKNNPKTLFVIDEAYGDFTSEMISMVNDINLFSNLLLIKSLTKAYAIPGLRLGYIIGQEQNILAITKNKMPWSVNTFAIEAGKFIIKNAQNLALPLATLLADTATFRNELQAIKNIEVYPSSTHFFLCQTKLKTAAILKEYLLNEHQLLIRDASNFRSLSAQHFRVATQTPENNQLLIQAIKQWTTLL